MQVSVFGIGYVGAVVAGCMARQGHRVTAIDVNRAKIDLINSGASPVSEPGLPEIIAAAQRDGMLRATERASEGVLDCDLSFVCVGTPGLPSGRPDTSYIIGMCEQLGQLLAQRKAAGLGRHTVVVRSTILPGTMEEVVRPVLQRISGMTAGVDFGLGFMPEFLREGQGVSDFEHPTMVVVGAGDEGTFDILRTLNRPSGGTLFECDFRTAEGVKFACNAWHAAKVGFANEIGAIAQASGMDGRRVMEILCADTKLNVSTTYLRPGFAFGGSCLGKDLNALTHHAGAVGVDVPLLGSILPSNGKHISRALSMIAGCGSRRVSLLGLTFKPDTDDLRDSPLVELAERLLGKGFQLKIFDPSFSYESIFGRNRQFINVALPHLAALLAESLDDALAHAETVVIGHRTEAFEALHGLVLPTHRVIDLVGCGETIAKHPLYQGICW